MNMSAQPATVAFHSSKNCFVNLPRSWTLKVAREKVAVFEIQGPQGCLFTSWAGGATVPTTAGLETIEINGLFSSKQNISHGDEVVVSPVTSAPPCAQVFVEPVSITDWEILEQHAAFIEGNLLNQVRAVWLGQVIPIWVQKNICIFIKIGKTVPSCRCCVLEQNTEVIVAPKARNAQPTKSAHTATSGDNKRNMNGSNIDATRLSADTVIDKQRKPRVRNMSGNKFVEGLKQAAESYNKPRSRGSSDAGLNGAIPNMDPAATSSPSLDPKETESKTTETGRLGRFVNYWKSWWHGSSPREGNEVSEDQPSPQAVYESEILKDGFDCLLRIQSLDAICDCGDAPGPDETLIKEVASCDSMSNDLEIRVPHFSVAEILLKQPTTVFIKPQTYLQHNTNTDAHILSPPRPFLAVLHKMLSPVEKEEIQTKKLREQSSAPNLPTQSASSKPDKTNTSTVLDQLDENNQSNGKSPRKVLVRVVITNWSHQVSGGFMSKSQLKRIGDEHVAIPDILRTPLGYESTGQVRLSAISHDALTVKQITFHSLSEAPSGFTKDMLLTAVTSWFETTSPVTCPLVVNQGTLLQIPLKPDLSAYFLVTFQQNKSATSASDPCSYVLLTPELLARAKLNIADQVPSAQLPPPLQRLVSGLGGDVDLSVPRVRLGQLGGISTLSEKAIRHINISLAQNPLSHALFSKSPGVATGGLLLCGGKGVGKSVIGRALCRKASEWPNMAYVTTLDCKALRGKRTENMRKILEQIFQEAAWRQPSVLLLDDLDRVTAAPAGPEHEMSGEALYYGRVAEVLKDIMDTEIENGSKMVVMATSRSRSSIHPSLVASRGKHYFTEIIDIPPPSETSRVDILKAIIISKSVVSPACIRDLDLESLSSRTEGYVAKDLEMVVGRAIHAHRMVAPPTNNEELLLCQKDVDVAMNGFTPAALRNVSLHKAEELGWVDVGGLRDIRNTLVETLQWPAKYPKLFASCPLRLRSGLLLYGAPGTGKTLLAGVLAKECGLNFISIKGPELLSKYIGASEQSVRDTFLRAQSAKPCILFFDEFDSLAPRRGHDSTGVTDRVVNQFLTQLDGVEGLQGVYVLGATSRPDLIDPALLRPGRLDKALLCPLPDESERLEILQALTRNMTLDPDVDLTYLADSCAHFTGADFKALLYNAQLEAIHEVTGLSDISKDNPGTSPIGTVLEQEDDTQSQHKPIIVGGEKQTVQFEEGQTVRSAEPPDVEHTLSMKPTVPSAIGTHGTVVAVLEKSVPTKRVAYIPSLEEGEVELTPERETQYLQQYDQTVSPSGGEEKKHSAVTVIRQCHLVTALSDMGPSVSAAERRKYAKIYETFVASRGGNFTEPVPPSGKKATLA